jgi:hypothetical protein
MVLTGLIAGGRTKTSSCGKIAAGLLAGELYDGLCQSNLRSCADAAACPDLSGH